MILAWVVAAAAVAALVTVWTTQRQRVAALERARGDFRDALLRLGQALGTPGDEATLVEVVLDVAVTLVDADAAVFWRDFGAFLVGRQGLGTAAAVDRRVEHGDGLVGSVAESRHAAQWPPSTVPPGRAEPEAGSAIAVPVGAGDRLHGVLALYRSVGRPPFSTSDLEDVAEVARQAGAGIRVGALYEETRRLSLTDGLTGVWNRRRFDLAIAQELERAARFGEPFAVVLADLDDFKLVNDTYGHGVGDEVLMGLATRLMVDTREVDLVARLGGEEFVLLLPHTDCAGAMAAADKLRGDVAASRFETEAGVLTVTLSVGVAAYPDDGTSVADLLFAADVALYQAKAAGKNCVRSAVGRG